jgi:ubiquinone/menaquinone biosynthesis C-methylase UbiE
MNVRDLAEMYAVETSHWWFAGKRLLFKRLLRERLARPGLRLLDVGCGTGAVAVDFGAHGWLCASDRSPDALAFVRSRGVRNVVASDAAVLPFADASFDIVTAFDVIEHVEDDYAMALELARVLRPGGALAVHVPAWPSLWSRHDELLEHKRRYTRRALRRLLLDTGFALEHLGWASATILPAAVVMRTASALGARRATHGRAQDDADKAELFSLPRPLNTAMLGVYRAETAVAASVGLPFGLSLAAIAVHS